MMLDKYRPSIRYGLIMGVIGIVVFLLVWALAPEQMQSFQWQLTQGVLFFLALPIVLEIMGARDSKANFEKYTYGRAFMAAFYVGLIAVLVSLAFNLTFRYGIDPQFYVDAKDQAIERAYQSMEERGLSDQEIERNMERVRNWVDQSMGLGGQFFMSGLLLAWYTILALLIGTIYKDKNPLNEFS